MPGLAGLISNDPTAGALLDRMAGALVRETGCNRGTAHHPALGIHVGWATHRGSFADCLPIWNRTRNVCLYFSGEVLADSSELNALKGEDEALRLDRASHLIGLYELHGPTFVDRLNGWFCGLLVDLRCSRAYLFNDRFGVGRLYLRETPDGLHFSSEARSLLRVFPSARSLDPSAVAETFSFGCVLRNRTLFHGLSLLPAGSRWTLEGGKVIDRRTYFDAREWSALEPLADDEFYSRLKDLFPKLLPPYMGAPGQTAMSLTGGLDGRMIMAWAKIEPGSLPCYSFGGTYRDCQDVILARDVARVCGQTHQTIEAGPELLAEFPDLASRCIEASSGTMDVSGAVEVFMNRRVRAISPIRLTGNYGSEILRGSVAFRPRSLDTSLFEPSFVAQILSAEATYRDERDMRDLTFIAFKQVPWHHHARLSVEQSVLTVRSPYLDNRLVELMYRASPKIIASREPWLKFVHDGNPALSKIPTDRGLIHGRNGWTDKLRNAWLEFTFKAEYAYDYGMPHRVARIDNSLSFLRLERLFLGQHKFYHFRTWYRRQLAPFLQDLLLAPNAAASQHFRAGTLKRLVQEHVRGVANHTLEIHRALTLELIHRRLLSDSANHDVARSPADKQLVPGATAT
jgi:asparagine synthase (glutamine-hydrolysing)